MNTEIPFVVLYNSINLFNCTSLRSCITSLMDNLGSKQIVAYQSSVFCVYSMSCSLLFPVTYSIKMRANINKHYSFEHSTKSKSTTSKTLCFHGINPRFISLLLMLFMTFMILLHVFVCCDNLVRSSLILIVTTSIPCDYSDHISRSVSQNI